MKVCLVTTLLNRDLILWRWWLSILVRLRRRDTSRLCTSSIRLRGTLHLFYSVWSIYSLTESPRFVSSWWPGVSISEESWSTWTVVSCLLRSSTDATRMLEDTLWVLIYFALCTNPVFEEPFFVLQGRNAEWAKDVRGARNYCLRASPTGSSLLLTCLRVFRLLTSSSVSLIFDVLNTSMYCFRMFWSNEFFSCVPATRTCHEHAREGGLQVIRRSPEATEYCKAVQTAVVEFTNQREK